MDERLKESISALVDDEANELEIQRVLSNLDDGAIDTWERFHGIRDTISGSGRELPQIDIRQSLADELGYDLDSDAVSTETFSKDQSEGVSNDNFAVSRETSSSNTSSQGHEKPRAFGASVFGIAASAVLALVLATQYQDTLKQNTADQSDLLASAGSSSLSDKDAVFVELPSNVLPVASTANVGNFSGERQPKIIVQLSDEHAKQFNQYLLRHAEHSVYGFSQGVMPLARVASVNSVGL